jgi:hypothetical protein
MRNSDICGEIRGNEKVFFWKEFFIFFIENILVARIYPENQEKTACVEYSTVYSPPDELQIPDGAIKRTSGNESSQSISESTISSSSNSALNSPIEDTNEIVPDDLSGTLHDMDSKSSSATITPVTKSFPK